jgi:hypothetical protein
MLHCCPRCPWLCASDVVRPGPLTRMVTFRPQPGRKLDFKKMGQLNSVVSSAQIRQGSNMSIKKILESWNDRLPVAEAYALVVGC